MISAISPGYRRTSSCCAIVSRYLTPKAFEILTVLVDTVGTWVGKR